MKRLALSLVLTLSLVGASLVSANPAAAAKKSYKCKNLQANGTYASDGYEWGVLIERTENITCKSAAKAIKAGCKESGMKGWTVKAFGLAKLSFRQGNKLIVVQWAGGTPPCSPEYGTY